MSNDGYGFQTPGSSNDRYRVLDFIIRQILGSDVRTAEPAVVLSVSGGGVASPPVVGVQVLVNQVDGLGNATPHGQIFNVPVLRLQCGNGAVICDPVVNDTGLLVVCDRDISSVQSTGGQVSNPGSSRRFDLSDGVFLPALFMSAPTQYVQFIPTGIVVVDKNGNKITMSATGVEMQNAGGSISLTAAGAVALVSTSFTWNGTPITVP
jgi:hypothetical protein